MPKKGSRKRLKYRAGDVCSESVTVADYADADPAIVKSGRVKKAVANAVEKEVKLLCGLEASQGAVEEVLSSAVTRDSSDDRDADEDGEGETKVIHKKKSKRRKESSESSDGDEYPVDIWLVLSSYIRPEDVCRFSLICRNAWMVTCTAVFWTRLYKRHYRMDADLPLRLQPDRIDRMCGLRARVIRSLFHMYEPFVSRVSAIPTLPEATPTTLLNSKCVLFGVKKVAGTRPEGLWEFSFKFVKQQGNPRNGCAKSLPVPKQYEDVHTNSDSDCYMLQVSTFNFIFTPVVMGMTLTLFTINVSTDMRHHRVRLVFQDSPVRRGKKRGDHVGTQVVLDPVHSVRLVDWWHPHYPSTSS
ncbi:transmembrane protein 183A isoform X1 [Corythoichthys intestinalis]|uniref:transmembrane protein 183A isoform X1 n=1 Tax=Corythoichthys intestinalis TaxID=161448 RepID=UPI0025A5C064|nr:transmembrane protein 183A isoform X1 [Corythoichthys intestinalis]